MFLDLNSVFYFAFFLTQEKRYTDFRCCGKQSLEIHYLFSMPWLITNFVPIVSRNIFKKYNRETDFQNSSGNTWMKCSPRKIIKEAGKKSKVNNFRSLEINQWNKTNRKPLEDSIVCGISIWVYPHSLSSSPPTSSPWCSSSEKLAVSLPVESTNLFWTSIIRTT